MLVFLSGAAGLIYEVLWMERLGLLFGNSAQASASTLAAFFLGLGLGSWWWGGRVARTANALKAYAGLEVGIFVSACAYFGLLWVFGRLYPWLLQVGGGNPLWALTAKFVLALGLVCPAAFFMGGTLPVVGQFAVRRRDEFGRVGARLYAVNTLGATVGAYLAGFVLPPVAGYFRRYLVALGLTASVACMAMVMAMRTSRGPRPAEWRADRGDEPIADRGVLSWRLIVLFCFASGMGTLALEVLWTHMLSLVYQNTVYSFAAILVTTLVCLAAGAGIAGMMARRGWSGGKALLVLTASASVWVGMTPYLFMSMTHQLRELSSAGGWLGCNVRIFVLAMEVMGIPLCLLGTLFPYLFKLSERHVSGVGRMLGRLGAINTAGAILGSLLAGFVLMSWWGMWRSIHGVAMMYALLAAVLALAVRPSGWGWRAISPGACLLCAGMLWRADLPPMLIAPQETLVESWHGASGTVAVVKQGDDRIIKIDGHYGLGGSGAAVLEQGQTRIPMMLHPRAKSIYFLGLGTGITAGEACSGQYDLQRIVACELVPEVVTAARKHFGDYTGKLFADPRCKVVVDDGRHHLAASRDSYDIIDSDLFVVYRKGAGSLYSLEHFRTVKRRLAPDGIFALWIPLYQLTKEDFCVIVRTMLEVFPQVTLWRNQFPTWKDAVALVGQTSERPLFADGHGGFDLDERRAIWERVGAGLHESNLLLYYCGNPGRARSLFANYPLNTDDRPVIAYSTPVSASLQAADKALWLAGPKFIALIDELQRRVPPEQDPALAGLSPEQRHAARAGYYLARAMLCEDYYKKTHEKEPVWMQEAIKARNEFQKLWLHAELP